jgi:hypothetical protein
MNRIRSLVLRVSISAAALCAVAPHVAAAQHVGHDTQLPASLVQIVREATDRFRDVAATANAGYGPALGCVSGPQEGAMGVHYVNPTLLLDNMLDPTRPEALIYEFTGGQARLVGAEFIVIAAVRIGNINAVGTRHKACCQTPDCPHPL